jgi:hypothetical protein
MIETSPAAYDNSKQVRLMNPTHSLVIVSLGARESHTSHT